MKRGSEQVSMEEVRWVDVCITVGLDGREQFLYGGVVVSCLIVGLAKCGVVEIGRAHV